MKVLVLVVDSLREDFCYGPETDTPTVDRLREEGTTFRQAISGATWTPPSMSSIFSGVYPHRLNMYDFESPFPEDVDSMFKSFEDEGYEVGSFVFDEDYLFNEVPEANVVDNFRDYERTHDWIDEHSDDDFFLFVHHYWVHGPYEPKESAEAWTEGNEEIKRDLRENHEEAVERCREKYADAVEEMSEEWLDGILGELERQGILDETLIVFTGDHGESWGERFDDKSEITKNFHLHGKLLYDELIRVPLVFRYPDEIPEGREIDEQVRHVDIQPTVTEISGVDVEDGIERDGRPLTDAFGEGDVEDRTAVSSATDVNIEKLDKMSVRQPDRKLIKTFSTDEVELYDLQQDPGETENLADDRPEDRDKLLDILEKEMEKAPSSVRGGDEVRDRLRDLGYL